MAGPYKTRCPHCGAQFKISNEHLDQAQGAARCGSCLHTFQASDHLLGDQPGPNSTTTQHRQPDATPNLGDDQLSDAFLSLDQNDPEGLGDSLSDIPGAGEGEADEAWAETLLAELEDEPEPTTTASPSQPHSPAPRPSEPTSQNQDPFDFLNSPPTARQAAHQRLDDTTSPSSKPATVIKWSLLSAVALLALVAQYAFFQFDTLARSPEWRPLYDETCQVLGCQLPLQSDPSQLRGANLVVRNHPRYQNALMVDALLFNEGDWPQPFPNLELTFKDLQGGIVATRRFTPSEYLHGDAVKRDAMPVNTPVHIALEIIDPGDQAVNYNLRLQPSSIETAGR